MTDIPLITLNDGRDVPTHQSPTSPPSDPFHGHEIISKIASRFISHLFDIPDDTAQEDAMFIAHAIHTSKMPTSVFWAALVVLQRLKDNGGGLKLEETESSDSNSEKPSTRGLFLCAYMVASQTMIDDYPHSNNRWVNFAQREFTLSKINKLERQLCKCVDWDVIVREPVLTVLEASVRRDFGDPKLPTSTDCQ